MRMRTLNPVARRRINRMCELGAHARKGVENALRGVKKRRLIVNAKLFSTYKCAIFDSFCISFLFLYPIESVHV